MKAYYVSAASGYYDNYVKWIVEDTIFEDKEEAEKLCKEYNEAHDLENLKKQFIRITFNEFNEKYCNDLFTELEKKSDDYKHNLALYDIVCDVAYGEYHKAVVVEINFKPKTK